MFFLSPDSKQFSKKEKIESYTSLVLIIFLIFYGYIKGHINHFEGIILALVGGALIQTRINFFRIRRFHKQLRK